MAAKTTCEYYTKGVTCKERPTQIVYYKKTEKVGEVCDEHAKSLTTHRLLTAQPIATSAKSK